MPDLTALIQTIFDMASGMQKADLKYSNAELKTRMADLLTNIQELRERINMLENEKENPLVFKESFYYSSDDADNKFPYCPACYDKSKLRIHLVKHTMKCPNCEADFMKPTGPYIMSGSPHWRAEKVMNGY